jgi:hypothetical protein
MTLQVNLKQIKADGASNNYVLSWSNAANSWTTVNVASIVVTGNSSVAGVLRIVDSYSNTSSTIAGSALAVKTAYDTAVTAQNMAANAYSNAASGAATAYSNAVSTASSDATTKAATAYSNATSYADTKAATAYSNAISYSGNAALAYANAIAYAASNTYVNTTFAPLAGATFTGPVSGITTLAAGNTTITGSANVSANLSANNIRTYGSVQIDGDLTVSGNTVQVNVTNLSLEDNMIYLNANNTVSNPDLGFAGNYNNGNYRHAGIFRDATDGVWKFFDGYQPEPDASPYIDTSNTTFRIADVQANTLTLGTLVVSNTTVVSNLNADKLDGQDGSYYAANSQLASYALLAGSTFTGNVTISATFAAGNTTITGKLQANTGLLSANTIQFNDGSQQSTYIDPIAMAIALG